MVAQLASQGYRGGLIVELYRGDFAAVEELIDSCRWLEGLPGTKNSL